MTYRRRKTVKLSHEERATRRRAWAKRVAGSRDRRAEVLRIVEDDRVSFRSVVKACMAHGVSIPAGDRPSPSTGFEILAALMRGESRPDVAKRLGISRQRVHQIIEAAELAGIPIGGAS